MSSISLFTPVSFEAGSQGCTQSTLSLLSNYFNIGEEHAVVVKGQDPAALAQKVKLVKDAPSTLIVALKIASYILLLPLALILFVAKCALQSQYTFTIEKAEKPEKKAPRKKKDPPPASPPSSRGSSPTPTGSPPLSTPPSRHT